MSSEKSIDQPEMKETDTQFLEYKSLPYQEGQDQAPMQTGEIEKSDFLTLNRKVDELLSEVDRSAEKSTGNLMSSERDKMYEGRIWI